LGVGGTRLELKEKVIFEEVKAGLDGEKGLAEMDKDSDLEDGVRVQVYQLDVVMPQELAKEGAAGEAESPLEIGFKNHYFISIGGWQHLAPGGTP
jgi:hypothetical protein